MSFFESNWEFLEPPQKKIIEYPLQKASPLKAHKFLYVDPN